VEEEEAVKVMKMLCAAWPWADLPADTADLWLDRMEDRDYAIAVAAANDLIDTELRFPTIAAFLSSYRDARERLREEQENRRLRLVLAQPAPEPEPVEPAVPPPPEFLELLRRFQRQVAIPQEG
jgi:hypothetical protein